jgi:spore germination protein YaaH
MRDVLDYAIDTIPKEKIWLGVHLYGYQWSSDRTIAFTYTTTEASFINDPNIKNIFKEDIGEGYAEFNCSDGFVCKAYFQTPRGVEMRRDIAEEYGIAGIAYWRLGSELDILK